VVAPFLIVGLAALRASVHRADRPDNFPAVVVRCTRREQLQVVLREQLALVLDSVPVSARVPVLVLPVQEWVAPPAA
jgi:hypothetical protein